MEREKKYKLTMKKKTYQVLKEISQTHETFRPRHRRRTNHMKAKKREIYRAGIKVTTTCKETLYLNITLLHFSFRYYKF